VLRGSGALWTMRGDYGIYYLPRQRRQHPGRRHGLYQWDNNWPSNRCTGPVADRSWGDRNIQGFWEISRAPASFSGPRPYTVTGVMICELAMERRREKAAEDDIDRLRRRDPDALPALIHRYQHRLYGYLLRTVSDAAAAEDLFQQTWLRVVERIHRYDPARGFEPWLFSVAHNVAIDHLRRKQPECLNAALPRLPAVLPQALDSLLAGERAAILAAAVAELPPAYRETVALRFEHDMKLEEIAEAVSAPLSTVKSRLRRGLEQLRARLQKGGRP
jgi:RNA polymerase sigma-70 factor (ECF subfamily)